MICACDDASQDDTVEIMTQCMQDWDKNEKMNHHQEEEEEGMTISMCMNTTSGISRGAGYTRNRAAELLLSGTSTSNNSNNNNNKRRRHQRYAGEYICILDSDDVMKPTRIAEQVCYLLQLPPDQRHKTLLGCNFERMPADATWHYTQWANNLTDERLMLEQYREVTLIQPTWMMCRERFEMLGGYVEAPLPCSEVDGGCCAVCNVISSNASPSVLVDKTSLTLLRTPKRTCSSDKVTSSVSAGGIDEESLSSSSSPCCAAISRLVTNDCCKESLDGPYRLIRSDETRQSLRLAEDLRLFHAHLAKDGLLKLLKTPEPLMMYRHRDGMSQSSQTPRRLLLKLRVKALEDRVLKVDPVFRDGFAIWGAGRDGKDFLKALQLEGMHTCFGMLIICTPDFA